MALTARNCLTSLWFGVGLNCAVTLGLLREICVNYKVTECCVDKERKELRITFEPRHLAEAKDHH